MATKLISQLPAAAAVSTHELPAMVGGVTSKVTAASLMLASDPASDGGEYVRVNGAWRLKSQTLDTSGLGTINVAVPVGAKMMRATGFLIQPSATVVSAALRISMDGTTFLAGATDYFYPGFIHYHGTTPTNVGVMGATAATQAYLTFNGNNIALGQIFALQMGLTRLSTSKRFEGLVTGSSYGATLWATNVQRISVSETNLGSGLAIKALQFMCVGGTWDTPSTIGVDWVY